MLTTSSGGPRVIGGLGFAETKTRDKMQRLSKLAVSVARVRPFKAHRWFGTEEKVRSLFRLGSEVSAAHQNGNAQGPLVLTTLENNIGTLTLNHNERRNALSHNMVHECVQSFLRSQQNLHLNSLRSRR